MSEESEHDEPAVRFEPKTVFLVIAGFVAFIVVMALAGDMAFSALTSLAQEAEKSCRLR